MDPVTFPFPEAGGAGPAAEFAALTDRRPTPATLPGGTPAILIHRHRDVRQAVTDPALSRTEAARYGMTARSARSLALNAADPPDHGRRRRTVAAAFTQRRADAMRPEIERIAGCLADRLLAGRPPANLVAGFTRPFAVTVICRLLGLPEADYARFGGPAEVMMSIAGHPPDRIAAAHHEVFEYFAERYDQRRCALAGADPAGPATAGAEAADVLAELVRASGPAGPLTREEAIHIGYGLLIAGYETTTQQLAICVYLLLAERSRWERLRGRPDELPTAVEELLRWTSLMATGGAPHAARVATTIGGVPVPPGQVAVPVFAAANRDPAAFDAPDELRLDRTPNPHLAFGHGRHLCLGAPLARVELVTALEVLLRQVPGLDLADPAPRWRRGMFVRGLTALPVRW